MKVIIDINEKDYNDIKSCNPEIETEYVFDLLMNCVDKGISIPDNATNGDVLKRLLYGKAIITEFVHDVNISVNNTVVGQFDMEWWNSPYKRGETNE